MADLDLALGVLAELPPDIAAHAESGGVVPVRIVEWRGDKLGAHVPTGGVDVGESLKMRVRDAEGSGYDIGIVVRQLFFHDAENELAQLEVDGVTRIAAGRAHDRAEISDLALVQVTRAEAIAEGVEFDVRLADVSDGGVSFLTAEDVREGDQLIVMATIDGALASLHVRALHTTRAHYGRVRVGCEVTHMSDADRTRLAQLTSS